MPLASLKDRDAIVARMDKQFNIGMSFLYFRLLYFSLNDVSRYKTMLWTITYGPNHIGYSGPYNFYDMRSHNDAKFKSRPRHYIQLLGLARTIWSFRSALYGQYEI